MLIFNLPNTHCSCLAPVKLCLWHIRSSVHLEFGTETSSTKPAWQSAKISETTSWYESPSNSFSWEVEAWWSDPSNCCTQFPIMGDAGITVATEGCSEPFLPCLLSFCSAFWLPYITCGQSVYKSGEASLWTLQFHFLRWLTPGDIVKLEVFKWLPWGFGHGYYMSCQFISNDQLWQCTGIWRQSPQILIWQIFCTQDSSKKVYRNWV